MNTQEAVVDEHARFLNALIEGNGIQAIIDIGYELLGNPIHVIDASYKVLAYTKTTEVDDPEWHKIVENKYMPYDIMSKNDLKENLFKTTSRRQPVLYRPKNIDGEVLHCAIMIGDKVAGYLLCPGILRPFAANAIEAATLLVNVLSVEMQKIGSTRNTKKLMYDYFIADLLEGNITTQEIIDDRLKCLNWRLQEYIYVLTLQSQQNDIDDSLSPNLRELLPSIISGGKSITYENHTIMVISRKGRNFPTQVEKGNLIEFLLTNQLYGGISRCFRSLPEIGEHYQQSLKAIELGVQLDKRVPLFTYEDYTLYHLISLCSSLENLRGFCHPALYILADCDHRYSEKLLQCLYAYLMNSKNLLKASAALGIHRNTMRSRLEKIAELTSLDIKNEDTCFHLLFSFKALWFLEATKNDTLSGLENSSWAISP